MDKHYGWQEERGSQSTGRFQNGQRWNERNRDDDRDARFSSGADLDRGDDGSEGQGRWSRGDFGHNREFSSQVSNRPFRNEPFRGQSGNQGFSGGHYGGFANEGHSAQSGYGGRTAWNQGGFGNEGWSGGGNYGGNRGFSNQGYSGQGYGPRYGDSWAQDDRDFQRQGSWSQGYSPSVRGPSSGQGFAGRGPKGYQRSDERIKELVSDRLMDADDIDATEITVEVRNGEVTLAGTVNSRQEKRAAEDAAEQTPGVREVQNHLRVQARESFTGRSVSGRQESFSKPQDSSSSQSKSKSTERE